MPNWDTYAADPAHAHERVFSVVVEGARYWVKRADKDYKNRMQAVIGGQADPHEEVRAMRALAGRGMLVPTIVHETPDYMVLSDIGASIQQAMRETPAMQHPLIEQVADTLSALHRAGGWHGNAMLRNFTLHQSYIGMIDFENTAHAHWSLAVRQAFDVWQVLYSTARLDNGIQLCEAFLGRYQPSSRARVYLRGIACLLSPLYVLLRPFRSHLKRDIRQAVIAVGTLLPV
jgi:tRNA A-37 threonylcarbamoyl transferase component Bud32